MTRPGRGPAGSDGRGRAGGADRPGRRGFPDRAEAGRGAPRRPDRRRRGATAPRASPPARRTRSCWLSRRTWCWMGGRRRGPGRRPARPCIVVHRSVRDLVTDAAGRAPARRARTGSRVARTAADGFVAGRGQRRRALDRARHPGADRRAAAAVRARPARRADAGAERRDAGAPGAHRPLRRGLVPARRHARRAGIDAGHRPRGSPRPGRRRSRDRHAGHRGAGSGGRPVRPAAGAAARRLLRHLGPMPAAAAPAVLLGGPGRSRRRRRRRPDRRAARRRVRSGRDRAGGALPGKRVGGPVRAVRVRP